MKTVSIHIVTFNSGRDIKSCLDALFQQDYPIDQIIVVDNNSQDSTREILTSYTSDITIVYNSSNIGFAEAHNKAIALSTSDFCLILNPDVILNPDYLSNLMQCIEGRENDRIGSLTGKLLRSDNIQCIDSCGLRMSATRRAFDIGSGEQSDVWVKTEYIFGVSGAAALYSREMITEISYNGQFFDNSFFAYKEDVDVAWRAQLFGWKAICIPQAVGLHGRGWKAGARKQQSLFVRKLSYINRYKMILKNDKLLPLVRSLFPIFLYEICALGYVLIKEPHLIRTWATIFKEWKEIMVWRKFIHKSKY